MQRRGVKHKSVLCKSVETNGVRKSKSIKGKKKLRAKKRKPRKIHHLIAEDLLIHHLSYICRILIDVLCFTRMDRQRLFNT